jgi:protoheme IX farnesyltransferase
MTRTHGFSLDYCCLLPASLWYGKNALAAMLGLFTLLTYLLVYTPLKRHSEVCTTVGALPGAMPPLIGYAAANGGLDTSAWALFPILFVWQFPHFYAIAWLYRDDYARGGIRMLPVIEPDGASTARRVVVFSAALIPISLCASFCGMTGFLYMIAAIEQALDWSISRYDSDASERWPARAMYYWPPSRNCRFCSARVRRHGIDRTIRLNFVSEPNNGARSGLFPIEARRN